MAIVRKYLAKDEYTKIDNQVARNTNISDYSYRLYGFIAGFQNSFQLNDAYVAKSLDWSTRKVTRAKKDLVDAGLILVDKIDRSTYFIYIGNSKVSATKVRDYWRKIEENPGITPDDIKELVAKDSKKIATDLIKKHNTDLQTPIKFKPQGKK